MTSKPSHHCWAVSWDHIGWLLKVRKSSLIQRLPCTSGTDTLSPGTRANTQPPATLPLNSEELKAVTGNWHRIRSFLTQWDLGCHPSEQEVGSATGKDQTRTLPQNGITSIVNALVPFWSSNHSGTLRHTDTEDPVPSSLHSITHSRHPGVLLGLEQVNNPKNLGSFSDLNVSRVNILFPSTCLFLWFL